MRPPRLVNLQGENLRERDIEGTLRNSQETERSGSGTPSPPLPPSLCRLSIAAAVERALKASRLLPLARERENPLKLQSEQSFKGKEDNGGGRNSSHFSAMNL